MTVRLAGLRPYLGAAGHGAIVKADGTGFAHRWPRAELHARFAAPGTYRLWAEFRLDDGTVVTAPFVVRAV